jgi:hypothetical protein
MIARLAERTQIFLMISKKAPSASTPPEMRDVSREPAFLNG